MRGTLKVKPRARKTNEMLNLKASQGVLCQEGCHIWKEKWTK